jgi:Restriction endonuclease
VHGPSISNWCYQRGFYVHTVGAVHPLLSDNSYDVVLDNLLRTRREVSKRIFTSSELTAADFASVLAGSREQRDSNEIIREIDRTGYLGLEEFVRDQLLAEGLNANLTRSSGDGGADIVVKDELGEIIYLVQCKHTTNIDAPIDAGLLEDARRVRSNWRVQDALVIGVTNAKKFAPRVIAEFEKIKGRLISRDELPRLRFS